MVKYNEYVIEENESGELFLAHVTNNGIYFDHNWNEGSLFVSHEELEELEEFRKEFLEEIGIET